MPCLFIHKMHEHNGFMFEDQAGYHGEDRCKNVRRREKKLNCVKSPPSTYSPFPELYMIQHFLKQIIVTPLKN